jgi:hypothetical protein
MHGIGLLKWLEYEFCEWYVGFGKDWNRWVDKVYFGIKVYFQDVPPKQKRHGQKIGRTRGKNTFLGIGFLKLHLCFRTRKCCYTTSLSFRDQSIAESVLYTLNEFDFIHLITRILKHVFVRASSTCQSGARFYTHLRHKYADITCTFVMMTQFELCRRP